MANKQKYMKGKGHYLRYLNEGRLENNRQKKLNRHFKKHPNDTTEPQSYIKRDK